MPWSHFLGLTFDVPYTSVLDTSAGVPWATWFNGGRCNVATMCVDARADEQPAIVWEGEDGETRTLTGEELRVMTDRIASGLHARGVREGDAVGLFCPMIPETVAALFAIAKLGAMFLPIFSGYGPDAVAIRLEDAHAVALVTADGFTRRDKVVTMKETADAAVAQVDSVHTVVVVPRLGPSRRAAVPMTAGRDCPLDELCALGADRFAARSRSTASTRCSSRTRAAPPAGPRVPCTCTVASPSRSPRKLRSKPTCAAASVCSGSPTSVGSWARGRSSARWRTAARSSSTTVHPTSRASTGSGPSSNATG